MSTKQKEGAAQKTPRWNTRVRTPSILQMEMAECGAASLAMICAYYKKYIPLEQLRVACGVARDGARADNLVKAAGNLGFTAESVRVEPAGMAAIKPPAIIQWNFNHFVVFEGFKNGRACINDPACGRRITPRGEFDLAFTGVVITFCPLEDFQKSGQRGGMRASMKKRLAGVRSALVFLAIVGLLMVIPGIVTPAFSRIFIDDLLLAGKTEWLGPLLWCMAATAVVQGLLTALQKRFLLRMETKLALTGASRFFWHILRLPIVFFRQRSPSDIHSRMGGNDAVAAFLSRQLAENVINLVPLVFYFLVMLQYSVRLTLLCVGLAAINTAYSLYASHKTEALNNRITRDAGKLYDSFVSGLYTIEALKATVSESAFFARWAGHHARQLSDQQKMDAVGNRLHTLPNFISGLTEVAVLCVGGLQIIDGSLTVGSLVAFRVLLRSFMGPINGLTRMGLQVEQRKGDMARLDDVIGHAVDEFADPARDAPAEEMDESGYRKLEGAIEVKDLRFGYNVLEPPLIDHFNLTLKPGARVALVGVPGSGKSTVARILAGINRPWSGEILLDGVPRDQMPRNVVSNSLAVVDQDTRMFKGTIRDNLAMWDDTVTDADLLMAARDACIHDDIARRKGGYEGEVAEGGANFSGGQRQRLEIARALALSPSILILDEATSALDARTEQLINDNIRKRGCTCIVVAHRLSAIRDCDEIIVMNRGRIVQRGTHDAMKESPGLYAELIRTAV